MSSIDQFKRNRSWLYDTTWGRWVVRVVYGVVGSIVSLLILFPLYWLIVTAFKTRSENNFVPPTLYPQEITIEPLFRMFELKPFELWIANSLLIAAATGAIALLVGIPAAYVISQRDFSGKGIVMSMFLAAVMFPGTAIMVPVWEVVKFLGLFNTRLILILVYGAMTTPFIIWLMKGFFDDFPDALRDAARIDQCSTYETFRYVVMPMAKSSIIATYIFAFLLAWNELVFALTLMQSQDKYTVPIGLLIFLTNDVTKWNDTAMASLVISIPVLIGVVYAQRYFVQGLTGGAIKG